MGIIQHWTDNVVDDRVRQVRNSVDFQADINYEKKKQVSTET